MTWSLSRYRAGDEIQVLSKDEILATLDEQGCLDGMPFMPEMLQYCGQRFTVRAVAHKTCETAFKTAKGRRLQTTVHLANVRCDGSAHGGCEADCTLFWKDAWLKPATAGVQRISNNTNSATPSLRYSEERLFAQTGLAVNSREAEPRFSCQATKLYDATVPLPWWDVRQYVFDVVSKNHSVGRVLRVLWLATLRRLVQMVSGIRIAVAICWRFSELMHRLLTGRGSPTLFISVQPCVKTPTGRLDLKPGEWVRIKPKIEIEKTLDKAAKNRGLFFDPEEMAPYCGGTYRVRRSVRQILDEVSGKMVLMKEPCIILDDVVCRAEYARCRLNCPRAIYSYWRELWLERLDSRP